MQVRPPQKEEHDWVKAAWVGVETVESDCLA